MLGKRTFSNEKQGSREASKEPCLACHPSVLPYDRPSGPPRVPPELPVYPACRHGPCSVQGIAEVARRAAGRVVVGTLWRGVKRVLRGCMRASEGLMGEGQDCYASVTAQCARLRGDETIAELWPSTISSRTPGGDTMDDAERSYDRLSEADLRTLRALPSINLTKSLNALRSPVFIVIV